MKKFTRSLDDIILEMNVGGRVKLKDKIRAKSSAIYKEVLGLKLERVLLDDNQKLLNDVGPENKKYTRYDDEDKAMAKRYLDTLNSFDEHGGSAMLWLVASLYDPRLIGYIQFSERYFTSWCETSKIPMFYARQQAPIAENLTNLLKEAHYPPGSLKSSVPAKASEKPSLWKKLSKKK